MAQDPALVGAPYVDLDEWRDSPRPHRYVHGGFENTHTLFSFYFPPAEHYRGRFFQFLEGGSGGHENMLFPQKWVFRLAFEDLGGYLVESNQGHYPDEGMGFANNWELFDASAESARFARTIATEMYGSGPHHGYVWGGSGGGARSIYCLENRPDVYDGAVPHVIWSSPLGSNWSPIGLWWLHARGRLAEIVDAVEPGGSGDPFTTLDSAQRDALAALYRFGYPRGAESQLWAFSPWTWGFHNLTQQDPGYFRDFWTVPGYAGRDRPGTLDGVVVDVAAKVGQVFTGSESFTDIAVLAATAGAARIHNVGITVDGPIADLDSLFGAVATFLTGEAKGRSVIISSVNNGVLSTSGEHAPELFDGVLPGDEVHFDNRDFIAWCHHFLHALPLDELFVDDSRGGGRRLLAGFGGLRAYSIDDSPLYPQRPKAPVPAEGGPNHHHGSFNGKMIHVNATHDAQVWPNGVVAYAEKVNGAQGAAADQHYRLWWVENSPHGPPQLLGPALTPERDPGVWRSRLVDYDGVTAQALRDLAAWVEDGTEPPPSTGYEMTTDGGITLSPTVEARASVQPLAWATVNGALRVEVGVGETVNLRGEAVMAPGLGEIVAVEWDPEGTGGFLAVPHDRGGERVTAELSHVYTQPGTYFASFRVGAHRDGVQGKPPFARNNARVRVVVR